LRGRAATHAWPARLVKNSRVGRHRKDPESPSNASQTSSGQVGVLPPKQAQLSAHFFGWSGWPASRWCSAVRTVDPAFPVHSWHGYLHSGPGDTRPARQRSFIRQRLRATCSFGTRRVHAIQHGPRRSFSSLAAFQTDQDAASTTRTGLSVPSAPHRRPSGWTEFDEGVRHAGSSSSRSGHPHRAAR